jgi:hypothetical protein
VIVDGTKPLIHVGNRTINLHRILYCERQVYQDEWTVKVFLTGQTTPLVLCQAEAKLFWSHLEGMSILLG